MTELGNVLSPETQSPPLSTTVDEQKGCGKLVTNRVKRMVAHQLGRVDPRGAWRERYAFNFFLVLSDDIHRQAGLEQDLPRRFRLRLPPPPPPRVLLKTTPEEVTPLPPSFPTIPAPGEAGPSFTSIRLDFSPGPSSHLRSP